MRLFASFTKRDENGSPTVELHYSVLHFLSGNYRWYCRMWDGFTMTGEGYGKNKFEAYRLAKSGYILPKWRTEKYQGPE